MPFKIVRNDITKMWVDAIVNTANPLPTYGSGVDAAIYRAAGEELLLEERKKIGPMAEGSVAITSGFALPAKYIIHAVSPLYIDGESGEEEKLRSCYKKSLELAAEHHCESIAFPLISTGSFGYPKEEGMRIALDEINGFLLQHDMLVYLVVFDEDSTRLGRSLNPALEAYIDRHYVEEKKEEEYGLTSACRAPAPEPERMTASASKPMAMSETKRRRFGGFLRPSVKPKAEKKEKERLDVREDLCKMKISVPGCNAQQAEPDYSAFFEENQPALKERMKHMSDTFQEYLLYLIESRGLTNAEVYKRAIITKQLFSKIKLNANYHPDKATAMRLCVGAKLNLDETRDLLARAGYALSPCDKRDIIFSFFIEHNVFDMIEIDIALEEHGLPCFIE